MIVELGHFALILALLLSVTQAFFGLTGAHKNHGAWMSVSRSAAGGQFFFTAVAFAALAYAFLTDNFSVHYVALNSNTELPAIYKFAAVWGAHEGSLLLWSLVLAGWGLAVALFSGKLPAAFSSRVVGIMGLLSSGFFLFMLLTSNPFTRLIPAPLQGRDLNPVLQDPGLAIHPPLLYIGYIGFAVAFAFAVAALIGGELDKRWARWVRPWTTLAWSFLTIGITIGSFWAYYELGWGGWWFWDPVENASFMPWLAGTALIHSLAVTEKRGAFISWTVLLAIAAFSLSLLGTFLVRSGVLISVHAFASDPDRGLFILMLLGVFVGGALSLYAWRAPKLPIGEGFKPFSRETFLLVNNVLLIVAAGAVLLGTLYPLFLDVLGLGRLSVGPPYFNAVFVPLILLLLLALGVGPYLRWKKDTPAPVFKRLRWPAVAALLLAVLVLVITDTALGLAGFAGLLLAAWVLLSAPLELIGRWRQGSSWPLGITGMTIAHIGAGLLVLGVTVVSVFGEERDTVLQPGESVMFAGYEFVFDDLREVQGPNYQATEGRLLVYNEEGELVSTLLPEKRQYLSQEAALTEAGIDAGLFFDLYVALGQPVGENKWSIRLQYKPMVRFIWLGGLVIALGGLLAALDKRYRRPMRGKN
ncbi:MAG TPA: heme lyase CcmF/NrfE family subunit [Gammaproteobacteria bacterium]|nr:heme lyase CcmF/NrfE family subunit [Gammaproteobacteria bacterium]